MTVSRSNGTNAALVSLENAVAATRSGFACTFSTSDEYENALIAERRALGRYGRTRSRWPIVIVIGCALVIAGCVVLFG